MYISLGEVELKSGETVEAGAVAGRDEHWAPRVSELLGHKGPIWNEQCSEALTGDLGIETYFYILHRDGDPFANILTAELDGVGIFAHVYTKPLDRQKGVMAQLMSRLMDHFRHRGGRALYLGTECDTHPYRLYEKFGFEGIEPGSGYMDWYDTSRDAFNESYFAAGPTEIEPLGWPHWPTSPALCMGDWPGVVRCAPLQIVGRESTEGPLLAPIVMRHTGRRFGHAESSGVALVQQDTSAVVGLAAWSAHPLWRQWTLIDVYCHPRFWDRAVELLNALPPATVDRCIAYADSTCPAKHEALRAAGFEQTAVLPGRLSANAAKTADVDAIVFERA